MKIKIKLKSFEEIASVAVPELMIYNADNIICLHNLRHKNFNQPEGKYLYVPNLMADLHDKELIVKTDQYENGYLLEHEDLSIVLGRWMFDIIGKVSDL